MGKLEPEEVSYMLPNEYSDFQLVLLIYRSRPLNDSENPVRHTELRNQLLTAFNVYYISPPSPVYKVHISILRC